jgi:hypothetical protein
MNSSITAAPAGQSPPKPQAPRAQATTITRRKLLPGKPGTRKLFAEYGEKLVCVRYRYNAESKRRIKTVELAIEEGPWEPAAEKIPPSQIMQVWIPYDDLELQDCVKAAGGKWNPQHETWELTHGKVRELELSDFIMVNFRKGHL